MENQIEEQINQYIEDLNSDSCITSARAIGKLGDLGKEGHKEVTLPLVWTLKNDPSEINRSFSALELGLIGDRRATPYLIEALNDEYEVRRDAVEALGEIGDKRAKLKLKQFENKTRRPNRHYDKSFENELAKKALRKIAVREVEDNVKKTGLSILLTSGIFLGANKAIADNPADLTTDYRQYPVHFYKVCFDGDKSKYAGLSIPFGEKKNTSAFGIIWADAENNNKMFLGNAAHKKGNFNFGLQTTKVWYNGGEIPAEFASTIDFDGKQGGLATLINFNDLKKSKLGTRVNYKDFIGYLTTPLKKLEPMFGLTYNGKIRLDLAYEPDSKTHFARITKSIKTDVGTVLPELRFKFNQDKQYCGMALGFYY